MALLVDWLIVNRSFFVLIHEQVMRDPHGISKGSGFVAFSTPEEASRAVSLYAFDDYKKFIIEFVKLVLS